MDREMVRAVGNLCLKLVAFGMDGTETNEDLVKVKILDQKLTGDGTVWSRVNGLFEWAGKDGTPTKMEVTVVLNTTMSTIAMFTELWDTKNENN